MPEAKGLSRVEKDSSLMMLLASLPVSRAHWCLSGTPLKNFKQVLSMDRIFVFLSASFTTSTLTSMQFVTVMGELAIRFSKYGKFQVCFLCCVVDWRGPMCSRGGGGTLQDDAYVYVVTHVTLLPAARLARMNMPLLGRRCRMTPGACYQHFLAPVGQLGIFVALVHSECNPLCAHLPSLPHGCVQGHACLDLPPITEKEVHVELSDADRTFYNLVRCLDLACTQSLKILVPIVSTT
jgi:hypothetical protein